MFALLADVSQAITGYRPETVICGPANEGYLFINLGIPIVCGFGPTGANAHAVDEHLDLDSLKEAALIYALTAVSMDRTTK